MAELIYSAIASLDGYVEDKDGGFEWAAPDEEVHAFVNDLERLCDHVVLLAGSRTVLASDVEEVLATHRLLTAARRDTSAIEREHTVLRRETTARQVRLWVRLAGPVHDPSWSQDELSLEEIVLAQLGADAATPDTSLAVAS